MAKIIQLNGEENYKKAQKFLKETQALDSDSEKINLIIDYLYSLTDLLEARDKELDSIASTMQVAATAIEDLYKRAGNKR